MHCHNFTGAYLRTLAIGATIILLAGCAELGPPVFAPSRIQTYCDRISEGAKDRYQAVKTCMEQEQRARFELGRMAVPDDVVRRCRDLSEATGGSYQVMLTCVQQELSGR